MIFKRYEYWSREGKKWTDWFKWDSNLKPELQLIDRRITSRLRNEYKEMHKVVSDQPSSITGAL